MPRLFIAAEIPEWAKEKIANNFSGIPDADWVLEEQIHLTLRFLGEIESSQMQKIQEGLGRIKMKSFFLTLHGLGLFPLRGDPEILWAGLDQSDDLLSLRHKIERLLVGEGLATDPRKFFPHFTLARIRNCEQEWVGRYLIHNSLLKIPDIPIQAFGLYSSHFTSDGTVYQLEEYYALDGILEAENE